MADGKIYYEDLFDSELVNRLSTLKQSLEAIQSQLDGMGNALRGHAQGLQSQVGSVNMESESVKTLAAQVEALVNAMAKWKNANDVNKEAILQVENSLKAQLLAAKLLNEQSKQQERQAKAEARARQEAIREAERQAKAEEAVIKAFQDILDKDRKWREKNKVTVEAQRRVEAYAQSIKELVNGQRKELDVSDMLTRSYNELAAAYKVGKDALREMETVTEEQQTAFKTLAESLDAIHDRMNAIQQSTGVYTLNVGNYKSAFDGLGFSIQQVLREAPSAQSLNQFFLAISNNLPLVVDQIHKLKRDMPQVKTDVESLTKKRAELQALMGSLQPDSVEAGRTAAGIAAIDRQIAGLNIRLSVGKAIIQSIFNWQTLILAGIFVISKWGGKFFTWLWKQIKSLFTTVKQISEEFRVWGKQLKALEDAKENISETEIELVLIRKQLQNVKKGTDEWVNGVKRVNELTGEQLNPLDATLHKIDDVIAKYREMALQIEKNKIAVEHLAEESVNQSRKAAAMQAKDVDSAWAIFKDALDDNADEKDIFDDFKSAYEKGAAQLRDFMDKTVKNMSAAEMRMWENMYKAVSNDDDNKGGRRGGGATYTQQYQRDRWKIEKLRVEAMNEQGKDEYDTLEYWKEKQLALEDLTWAKSDDASQKARLKGREDLQKDLQHGLITREQYNELYAENEEIYQREIEASRLRHIKKVGDIQQEYENKNIKLQVEAAKKGADELAKVNKNTTDIELVERNIKELERSIRSLQATETTAGSEGAKTMTEGIKALNDELQTAKKRLLDLQIDAAKVQLKAIPRRAGNRTEEGNRNSAIVGNINALEQQLRELKAIQQQQEVNTELWKEAQGEIDKTNQQIDKMREKLTVDKALKRYDSIWDLLGVKDAAKGSNIDTMKGILERAGVKKETLETASAKQIEGWFETWTENMEDAVSEWYNVTMGYVSEMIDAYVELAEAKAEAAAEATEAAQQEYEKEKALLEAGYANNVETTWAEYQEKKKAQELAEREAKEAAQMQQDLDTATQLSSMITAAANIWKSFTALPKGIGIPLAIAGIGTMFGSFIAAKTKAAQAVKYGQGTAQLIDYGGSHSSGNDVPLGYDRYGREERIERGEIKGVINKRGVRKYGAQNIIDTIEAWNNGTYDTERAIQRNLSVQLTNERPNVDLSKIERTLMHMDKGTNVNPNMYVDGKGRLIERRGNRITIHTNIGRG